MKLKPLLMRAADSDVNPASGSAPATENVNTVTEPAKTEKTFTQAELEAIIADRLERAKRKAETEQSKAREEAERKALAEQGEWKTLAEKHATEAQEARTALEAAKGYKDTADRYKAALEARVAADKKDLPESILALLNKSDVADQMEWLAANLASIKAVDKQTLGTPPRNAGSKGQKPVAPVIERRRSTI
jgi:HD-GYP domain-containing protein (c-di-GMP phosphodiesterase class II)